MEKLKRLEELDFRLFSPSSWDSSRSKSKNFIWRGTYEDALDFMKYCALFDSFEKCLHKILFHDFSRRYWSVVYSDIIDFWEKKALFRKKGWEKDFFSRYQNWDDIESAESAEEHLEYAVTRVLTCKQVKQSVYREMIHWDYSIVIFSALFFLFEENENFEENQKKRENERKKELGNLGKKRKDEQLLFSIVLYNLFSKKKQIQQVFYYFLQNTPFLKNNFSNAKKCTQSFLISNYRTEINQNSNWTEGNYKFFIPQYNFIIPQRDKEGVTLLLGCFSDLDDVKKKIPGLATKDPVELQIVLDFLENQEYGVMQSHEQLVKSRTYNPTPIPQVTPCATVQSYYLAQDARKPLSKIEKGLSLNNRESLIKLIVPCNNASASAERVSQCRNHYQPFDICFVSLHAELIGLRSDLTLLGGELPGLCVDEQTRTAAIKFVEDTIKSVDNSINSKVITTPMDKLHDRAQKRDKIDIDRGHHGNVSARGFRIDKYRLEKLDQTIDQYFSGKSYTIGETAEHQNKKVESYPLNNLNEQHWQDFSLSLDSTEVVEESKSAKEATQNSAEEQNLAAEMEAAEEPNSAAKSDWPYEEVSEALPGHNSVGEPDWAFGKNSKNLKTHPLDDMTDDQDMKSAAEQKLFAELDLLEESKRNELDKKIEKSKPNKLNKKRKGNS